MLGLVGGFMIVWGFFAFDPLWAFGIGAFLLIGGGALALATRRNSPERACHPEFSRSTRVADAIHALPSRLSCAGGYIWLNIFYRQTILE